MAEKDEYLEEAYEDLRKTEVWMSRIRLEHEVRQKTIRDHNSQMKSTERRGKKLWIEIGSGMTAPLFFDLCQ